MNALFPDSPELVFYDPLGELLGAGDGRYRYRFDDAVKLAGHACPTVAGAFLLVLGAVERLYGSETPQRGGLRVTVYAAADQGATGPLSQVLTLLTGAAADNGFQGLAGQHVRRGLLRFAPDGKPGPLRCTFERVDDGRHVNLAYDPSAIPPAAGMGEDMQAILAGRADAATTQRFRAAWRERVERLLADRGRHTLTTW